MREIPVKAHTRRKPAKPLAWIWTHARLIDETAERLLEENGLSATLVDRLKADPDFAKRLEQTY